MASEARYKQHKKITVLMPGINTFEGGHLMRAHEFMDEARKTINPIPTNVNAIELQMRQYELLKKRAEWQSKQAEVKRKLNDDNDHSSKVVSKMAKHALAGRQNGVYGLSGDNAE
jgi:hypothetical protein